MVYAVSFNRIANTQSIPIKRLMRLKDYPDTKLSCPIATTIVVSKQKHSAYLWNVKYLYGKRYDTVLQHIIKRLCFAPNIADVAPLWFFLATIDERMPTLATGLPNFNHTQRKRRALILPILVGSKSIAIICKNVDNIMIILNMLTKPVALSERLTLAKINVFSKPLA